HLIARSARHLKDDDETGEQKTRIVWVTLIRPGEAGVVLGFFLGATATCAALLEHTFPSIGRKDDNAATETTTGCKMSEVTSETSSGGEMGEWKSA
ncbi:hypothetical protein D6D01_09675, partial [Aureobasidium pullulans]